ncbi:hypothetical protein M9H77_16365 [Catharanthus roseus]|uniref:Uncharacterized protein n=1 Tax=Catharanthus roseus TaxID=4058 RepID=A0ACC0B1J9_CATRO|nr:hypothetical protein M9H77_16365 [Catharanthus roseus]
MEEVSVHMYPVPIVPDVLSRQHDHRSGLIWNGDHETCYTDLQCRRFGRNLFQCYSTTPRRLVELIDGTGLRGVFRCGYIGLYHTLMIAMAVVHGSFGGCTTDLGALVLLQIWVWSRIPALRPQLITDIQADPLAPLGAI